ncbi:hypothetical protein RNJ44_00109 [Nakaseomyces bracarensis]|uniref:Uncharacterized protein n=1 Tax=Nakaseomyces bracarensis TaxID=273131 RepID=A0ABR4P146_9SACH
MIYKQQLMKYYLSLTLTMPFLVPATQTNWLSQTQTQTQMLKGKRHPRDYFLKY